MKKGLILSLMFLLTLTLCVSLVKAQDVGNPFFNISQENYASNISQYTRARDFGFQVNVYNGSNAGGLQNITFELERVSGTTTNYTEFSTIAVTNISAGNTYYINFTQEELGRASNGTNCYQYRWHANTTTGDVWNTSLSTKSIWCLNVSTATEQFLNLTRRSYPQGTAYNVYSASANLNYSNPISQNITGWYSTTEFGNQAITFTLYKDGLSEGTSNPQETTTDYTDQTDVWMYNTSGTVNYTAHNKNITITYIGGGGGGGGTGATPPPTNIPCPYECCIDDGQHINKECEEGTCINNNCILGVTTTPTVTTLPGFDLPIIGEVEIGMNTKFMMLAFIGFIVLIIFLYLIYVIVK